MDGVSIMYTVTPIAALYKLWEWVKNYLETLDERFQNHVAKYAVQWKIDFSKQ
jgi:hypothetical protein